MILPQFPSRNAAAAAAVILTTQLSSRGVNGHGYLKSPRSRNYHASVNPIWFGGTANDPAPENCPHCLNIGGTEARCGKVGDHNYDYPPNAIGQGVLPPITQACYEEEATIEFESVLTAHHKGHFEFKACPIQPGEVPTQECFDEHPLTFVSDELYTANADPLYPERAYIPRTDFPGGLSRGTNGDYLFQHRFKLPGGLSGDLVLIQWYYITGNSCMDEGYDTYEWPEGFHPGSIPVCDSIPPDGRGVPEQFWNCAEVSIKVANGCDNPSAPVTTPTLKPTMLPTSNPTGDDTTTTTSTSASTSTVTTAATATTAATTTTSEASTTTSNSPNPNCLGHTQTCGLNKPCPNGACCSQWGYCGISEIHCGECCQNGNCFDKPPLTGSPTQNPTQALTSNPTSSPVTGVTPSPLPTSSPIISPTAPPTTSPTKIDTTSTSSTTVNTEATITTASTTTSSAATESTTTTSSIELVLDDSTRCGFSEIDAREHCKPVCATDSDCGTDEFCWDVHTNYCGSVPQKVYVDPVQSPVVSRCGVSEEMARTFCGEPCSWQCSKPGDSCIAVHSNYCDSNYTIVGEPTVATTVATTTSTSVSTVAGTGNPSNSPSKAPTEAPTKSVPTTLFPSSSPISRPPTSSAAAAVEAVLEAHKDQIDNSILLYQEPSLDWVPSTVYRYQDMLEGLRVMYNDGVANKYFFMGDDTPDGHKYGLVNIAAFLAQSMKETIQYNACDENSWDLVNGKYPLSNACGQLGQSYQDYKCSASEAHMECPVKKDMEITATTNAKWWGAPAPLFCGPKEKHPVVGFWDHTKECNKSWMNPPEVCDVYEGQLAGGFDNSSPVPNASGRTDVEGCCFWGRGVIQTTGVCNFGKLNYYLGSRAAEEGRDARYPDVNFCEQPDAICGDEENRELKWIAGMFYWVESLQSYNVGGWDYVTELKKYVDGGMSGNSFIDAVSGIVNRGCHDPPCATGDVDGKADRSSNFYKVLTTLDL